MSLVVWSIPARAQQPGDEWRTARTAHFRVHYPAEYEAWALRTAARLDAIRDRLVEVIGHAPNAVVDVVVSDPLATPNGLALPMISWPRIVLYTTPPAADSEIGHLSDWGELLAVHEDAHIVHLTRPSRNPLARALARAWLPVGPVALRAPRWVVEGYATLIEGELTGAGRPSSDVRAAILRRWAQRGRLPSYSALGGDEDRWRGMSMAYLAGSAYLEWLQTAHGADSLPKVWSRLTARQSRTFDDAFAGVFGAPPSELYGRFVAELTERAMAAERAIEPTRRDGELWQHLTWTTGLPAVSPDGERIAMVVRDRDRPSRLVVWSTGPDTEEAQQWQERIDRMLERDPDDVAPVRARPLPREPQHVLPTIDGVEPRWPRWTADGERLLFVRFEPDADGFLVPDVFAWHPPSGRVQRVTRLARVWKPDPAPDGTWAVAVRHQYGQSQLVRVVLATGDVEPITPPSVEIVYDHPRVDPTGQRVAYLRLQDGAWRAVIRDLDTGDERVLNTPAQGLVAHPAWSTDGQTLLLSVGTRGLIDVWAYSATDGSARPVTRTDAGAFAPAPSPDGRLFFLANEPHGFDLRVLDDWATGTSLPTLSLADTLWPAVTRPAEAPTDWPTAATLPVRPYGLGRQEFLPLPGGGVTTGGRAVEAVVRGGDLIGRLGYLGAASFGWDGGPRGAAVAGAWRMWPVDVRAHVFTAREEPSAQRLGVPDLGTTLDARETGVELGAQWQRRLGAARSVHADGGVLLGAVEPRAGDRAGERLGRRTLFADVGYRATPSRGWWSAHYSGMARGELGRTDGSAWRRTTLAGDLGAGVREWRVRGSLRRAFVRGDPTVFDLVRLGGANSSVLPVSALHGRVLVPALPAGILVGTDHESQRVTLTPGRQRFPLFYERHRVWQGGALRGDWTALAGIEARIGVPPTPLARLPAADLTFGVARLLDEPFRGRTRAWLNVVWRP
jgi:hypothetical protein